jgi:uncharacterized protein (DUF58 family)
VSAIAAAIPREEYARAVKRGQMRRIRMLVRPTARLIAMLGLFFSLGVAAAFVPRGPWYWLGALACFALVAIADAVQALRTPFLTIERMVASALAMGMPAKVRLVVRSTKSQRFVVIADHVPQALETTDLPLTVDVTAGVDLPLVYTVTPLERGNASFGPVEAWTDSVMGFWSMRRGYGAPQTVRVYPNFRAAARFALLAAESRSQTTGVKQRQRRGAGLEFAELREYAQGDMPRHIDWKATARRRKMTTRAFRDEQDQQLVMLLDCGRRLRARDDGQSHFDHALNASLLLAWVALRQGDRVGLATFGGRDRFLAPGRGLTFFNTLLNATYDLQTTTEASDIASALERVVERVRRRSLVIVLTNLRDDADEELVRVMRHARERHLVVAASLREVALRVASQSAVTDFDSAVRVAATHHYVDERERSHAALRAMGLDCLDVEPARLPAELVNFYLALKASGRL